jgi:hypothetical protein
MNIEQLEIVIERRIGLIREVLTAKQREYAGNGDRMHNFNRAAAMLGVSRERALIGMLAKHLVSILDIVGRFDQAPGSGPAPCSAKMIEEKLGDAVNYLILYSLGSNDKRGHSAKHTGKNIALNLLKRNPAFSAPRKRSHC